jgi:protein CpxP
MKRLILSAAFLSIGTFVMAQQESLSMQKDPAQMEQRRADKLKMMQTELNLTNAQVAQIKALQDKKMAERKANEPQMQAERKAKMEQMKAKKEQWDADMKQILTPEQYTKWEVKKQEEIKERKGKMQGKKRMKKETKN